MAVDRSYYGPGEAKELSHEPRQEGEKVPDVARAFPREPKQVNARREDRTSARENEGTDILSDAVQFLQEGVEQFDIECARLPMRQAEGENTFPVRACDHFFRLETMHRKNHASRWGRVHLQGITPRCIDSFDINRCRTALGSGLAPQEMYFARTSGASFFTAYRSIVRGIEPAWDLRKRKSRFWSFLPA
jgi:hypothetical protein